MNHIKTLFFIGFLASLLFFSQFLTSLQYPFQFTRPFSCFAQNETLITMLSDSVTFLPLKDLRFKDKPMSGNTWFMSSINDTFEPNDSEYLHFPSNSSNGRLLCLLPRDRHDGAKNFYGFAYREALPHGTTLLPGMTYVSDTYYDYSNIWHGITTVVPFVGWYMRRECAIPPSRWVLFHWGELRTEMSNWLESVADASIGEAKIENFEGIEGPACFEEAVVFRHNQGGLKRERALEVYERIRCTARESCRVDMEKIRSDKDVKLTILLRAKTRAFKNETAVVKAFEEACRIVGNCRVTAAKSENLTFCDQVRLLSETDILATPHGAQMTNMIFMERNSSAMEFYPFGWKEMAGSGQYVFRWLANWAGINHTGAWRDPEPACNVDPDTRSKCLSSFKDKQIGHNATEITKWASEVLRETKEYKKNVGSVMLQNTASCRCG